MTEPRTIWQPNPGSQVWFLTCPVREALLEGTRGGGKTDALLMDFAQDTGKGYGAEWRGILFRNTYPQLEDVVAKSRRWFPQIFKGVRFNASDYFWKWPTGETLFLRHFNKEADYWNYHGHEYPWIGWEELTNWPTADCYDSMFACNRSSHPGVPRKVRGTTNPYGRGHQWVKLRFIDPAPEGRVISETREIPMFENGELVRRKVEVKRIRIHSSYLENPKLLVADPMYLANIENISNEAKRRAWLFGDWTVNAGGMFDDVWHEASHVIEPFSIPEDWRIDRAFDWGSSKPFSVGWWAESDGTPAVLRDGTKRHFPRGTLFRIAEWYGWTGKPNEGLHMLAADIATGIREREAKMGIAQRVQRGPADSSIFDVVNGMCIADDMRARGITWLPADKSRGSRKNGWEIMRTYMQAATDAPLEEPGLFIFSNCRQFIRTVPSLPRDELDMDDIDTTQEDHIADESRYRITMRRGSAAQEAVSH